MAGNDESADTSDSDENHSPIHIDHIINCTVYLVALETTDYLQFLDEAYLG